MRLFRLKLTIFLLFFFCYITNLVSQNIDSIIKVINEFEKELAYDKVFETLEIKKQIKNKTNTAYIKLLIREGEILEKISDYPSCLNIYNEALEKAKKIKNNLQISEIYNNYAVLFNILGEDKKAEEYISKAYILMNKTKNYNDPSLILNYGVIMFKVNKMHKKAFDFFSEEIKKISPNQKNAQKLYNLHIADYYITQNDFNSSIIYYKKSLNLSQQLKDQHFISTNLTRIGESFINLNILDSAKIYNKKALEILSSMNNNIVMREVLQNFKQIYRLENDMDNYTKIETQLDSINHNYFGYKTKTEIAKIEYANSLELKKSKIKLLEKKNQLKTTLIIVFLLISLLFIILLFMAIKRTKYIKIINNQRLKLIDKEKRARSQELINKTTSITKKTELLNAVHSRMKEMQKVCSNENEKNIEKIIHEINVESNEYWDDFYIHFKDLHPSFFVWLKKNHPSLTPTETKIIALIKLNYKTKEIASITYTSQRTIQKHRENIRQKMNVDSKTSLNEVIKTVT